MPDPARSPAFPWVRPGRRFVSEDARRVRAESRSPGSSSVRARANTSSATSKCRLKDITDLFLDTGLRNGYAIIEQGKVKDIIQARPEEIRYLIEDAAEVGRFRIKRTEALRRLEATSRNLERINDLLGEVTKQRNRLKTRKQTGPRVPGAPGRGEHAVTADPPAFDIKEMADLRGTYASELRAIDDRIGTAEEQGAGLRERLAGLEALSGAAQGGWSSFLPV